MFDMFDTEHVCYSHDMTSDTPEHPTLAVAAATIAEHYAPTPGPDFEATVIGLATARAELKRLDAAAKCAQMNARRLVVDKSAAEYGRDTKRRVQVRRIGFRKPGTNAPTVKLDSAGVKRDHPALYEKFRVPKPRVAVAHLIDAITLSPELPIHRVAADSKRNLRQTIVLLQDLTAARTAPAGDEAEFKERLQYFATLTAEHWDPLGMIFDGGWRVETAQIAFNAKMFAEAEPEVFKRYSRLVDDPGAAGHYKVVSYSASAEDEIGS